MVKIQQLAPSLSLCAVLYLTPVQLSCAQFQPPTPMQQSIVMPTIFGLFSSSLEDEVDRFTLYGKTLKKYLIEKIEKGKIIGRSKGFTVTTCVGVIPEVLETPQFRGLSPSGKVEAIDSSTCVVSKGQDLLESCKIACSTACERALGDYIKQLKSESGLDVANKDKERVMNRCQRQCKFECNKPGKISDFDIPSQR
eukprot:g1736.t1